MEPHGFLQQALIYLAAGVIAVPVFKRLGLGSVLGYLAAGMVIGPWGLKLIADPQTVLEFAEFGVVMLLFLIGLELEPRRLWALRRAIFAMGATQVLVTAAVFALGGKLLGLSTGAAIVTGLALAMSSTAIALASLQEKNLLPTPGGQASFSVLLFQDLAVIPALLAVQVLLRGDAPVDWEAAGIAAALVVALIAGGRLLLRPALRYIANARLREVFVGAALLLVLGIAMLMEMVGLSMALGAFLAGVILADSEYRHELEIDIEPFKGLLLGLFFIAIGMSVDLGVFVRTPLLVLALTLGILSLKAAALYPTAMVFGYCGRADASLFALSLAQVGEFAFVLFTQGAALFEPGTLALLNASVACSMAATPLLMLFYERVLAPKFARSAVRVPEVVDEKNPVIVAGYGRFGQVVTRVLNGLKIEATVIDHDPNQVDTVRRYGSNAYYGDATRLEVLERAGIERARLLVVAIDDEDAAMRLARLARARWPQLRLIVRARSRTDAYEYFEMGVTAVRETFGSALEAAELALRALGYGPVGARRVVTQFRRHDEALLERMAPHRGETTRLIAINRQGQRDLEELLGRELPTKIDENNARADQQRGSAEGAGDRVAEKHDA